MATESLIIELDARTEKLEADLKRVNKQLGDLEENSEDADKGLGGLSGAATATAGAIKTLSVSTLAAATALTTMIVASAKSQQELEVLASTAKTTTEDFEALSYATKQYGLDAKGTADAMNDVIERLGEFSVGDGAGAFDDFAQAMGLTSSEAQELASSLSGLSGEQALRELVNQMEDANLGAAEMSFVMKSLSSDLEYITPLFAENGEEVDRLKGSYSDLTSQLNLTAGEAEDLRGAAESFDLLTSAAGKSATKISAQLAPAFEDLIDDVIDRVPRATELIVDFMNSFRAPDEILSIESIDRQIETLQEQVNNAMNTIAERQSSDSILDSFFDPTAMNNAIDQWSERIRGLQEQREKLAESQAKQDEEERKRAEEKEQREKERAKRDEERRKAKADSEKQLEDEKKQREEARDQEQTQAILDRFKTEEELRLERYLLEQEQLAGQHEALKLLEAEYLADVEAMRKESADKQANEYMSILKEQGKIDAANVKGIEQGDKDKEKSNKAYTQAAIGLSNELFEDNKAMKSAMAVMNTAEAITEAAPNPYLMAFAAATGAAQLAKINSTTKSGGGTISTAQTPPSTQQQQQDIPQTQDTTISASDASGANQNVIISFESDDDATAEFINGIMKNAQITGTIS